MLDLERSKSDEMLEELWQTDTSVGSNSWFYCREWISKSPNLLIDDLEAGNFYAFRLGTSKEGDRRAFGSRPAGRVMGSPLDS
jgi:hypothetical protein